MLHTDLINATIVVSVLSIGLSCVYAGSRTLTALAETGFAPKIFTYGVTQLVSTMNVKLNMIAVDKSSRPVPSVIAILIFGPIAYVNTTQDAGDTVCKFTMLVVDAND